MVYKQLLWLGVIKEICLLSRKACWVARLSISKCRASIATFCMGPKITLTKLEKFSGTYTLTYTTFTRSTVIQHGMVRYDYNRSGARSHCAKSNRTESRIDN